MNSNVQVYIMITIIILFALLQVIASDYTFARYHHVSRTHDGKMCLTGCDISNNKCVVDWSWNKLDCTAFELAPIFNTAGKRGKETTCLSNCGYFGNDYEWCITNEDLDWDYCSSHMKTNILPSGEAQAYTSFYGKPCVSVCRSDDDGVYWCDYKKDNGDIDNAYCAIPALIRVPVLYPGYQNGEIKKGKCDSIIKYDYPFTTLTPTAIEVPDDFVKGTVEAIDSVYPWLGLKDPIRGYKMIHIKETRVAATITARVTKQDVEAAKKFPLVSDVPTDVINKFKKIFEGSAEYYEVEHLIGLELGGTNAEYNLVPLSENFNCEEWADMERGIKDWCLKTGGSVDMVIAVYYITEIEPKPSAVGVALTFRNPDGSEVVDCREKLYFN